MPLFDGDQPGARYGSADRGGAAPSGSVRCSGCGDWAHAFLRRTPAVLIASMIAVLDNVPYGFLIFPIEARRERGIALLRRNNKKDTYRLVATLRVTRRSPRADGKLLDARRVDGAHDGGRLAARLRVPLALLVRARLHDRRERALPPHDGDARDRHAPRAWRRRLAGAGRADGAFLLDALFV